MTIDRLLELIKSDPAATLSLIETRYLVGRVTEAIKQFNPKQHEILDTAVYKDKPLKDNDGKLTGYRKVNRIPLAIQERIVNEAAAFLGSPTYEASPANQKERDLLTVIDEINEDNKADYKFRRLVKHTKSERHAAKLWYFKDAPDGHWEGIPFNPAGNVKIVCKILAPTLGDELYPVWDDFGDMIAFVRGYKLKDEQGTEIKYVDILTDEWFYYIRHNRGSLEYLGADGNYSTTASRVKNIVGKIPVAYFYQPLTEWEHVQPLIERLEKKLSKLGDTNDYVGSPIAVAKNAEVVSMPDKGEEGKLIEIRGDGDMKYLTYDQAPESHKLEIELLEKYIEQLTNTPNTAFSNLKNLGYFSTIALKTLFMDAHMKAEDSIEIFGEGEQRSINYLKGAIAVLDTSFKSVRRMKIKPKFEFFLPKDTEATITLITQAVSAGIMSKETATRYLASSTDLIPDADAEIDRIKEQGEASLPSSAPDESKLNDKLPLKARTTKAA